MTRVGDKIRILRMEGEPQYEGRTGTVDLIDDAGQIHGTWGGCALIPGVDSFETIRSCALCGNEIGGRGHNGAPLTEGTVCDACNYGKVLPARMGRK